MPPNLFYHIPLAGVAAIILLYFSISAWKFGKLRPLLTALCLAMAIAAGHFVFRHIAPLLEKLDISPKHLTLLGCAVVAGVWVFFALRKLGDFLSAKAYNPDGLSGRLSGGAAGALLGFLPAILVIAVIATGLRRVATVSELKHIETCSALHSSGLTLYPDTPYFVNLCGALEELPRSGEFFRRVDPAWRTATRHLAGLGLISRNHDLYLSIGNGDPGANAIYADPSVVSLLESIEVTRLLDAHDHEGLLADESVREIAALPGLAERLDEIDVIDTLHSALGMK